MKRSVTFLCFLFVSLVCSLTFAQEDSNKKMSYLTSGEEAPFTGILLSNEAYAELRANAVVTEREIKLRVDYEVKKSIAERELEIKILQEELRAEKEKRMVQVEFRDERIKDLKDIAYKKENWFQKNKVAISFVGGVIFTGLSVWGLDSIGDKLKE